MNKEELSIKQLFTSLDNKGDFNGQLYKEFSEPDSFLIDDYQEFEETENLYFCTIYLSKILNLGLYKFIRLLITLVHSKKVKENSRLEKALFEIQINNAKINDIDFIKALVVSSTKYLAKKSPKASIITEKKIEILNKEDEAYYYEFNSCKSNMAIDFLPNFDMIGSLKENSLNFYKNELGWFGYFEGIVLLNNLKVDIQQKYDEVFMIFEKIKKGEYFIPLFIGFLMRKIQREAKNIFFDDVNYVISEKIKIMKNYYFQKQLSISNKNSLSEIENAMNILYKDEVYKNRIRYFLNDTFEVVNSKQKLRKIEPIKDELPVRPDKETFIEFFWVLIEEKIIISSFSEVADVLYMCFPSLGKKSNIKKIPTPSKKNFKAKYKNKPSLRVFLSRL